MTSKSTMHRYASLLWVVVVALVLTFSSSLLPAQDGEGEPTLEELQEERELAAQQLADAAASIDADTATVEELAAALDGIGSLAGIHQLRLDEAIERYDTALDWLNQAEASRAEVLDEIELLRDLVGDLALAEFTGETGKAPYEIALSTDPGQSSRLAHLLELQIGSAEDAVDRLRLLELQAEELIAERDAAASLAEQSLTDMQNRSGALVAAIDQQEQLLQSAESRLAASESEAQAAADLIEETESLIEEAEQRLAERIRALGAPAPVDRADIVTISFFDGTATNPFFQIQVHKDIEEQTRGLYELAFSQGINLGGWGYRGTDRQIELRRAHCGSSNYDIWLKPSGQCSPPTARPGFSKHEQGRAIDFQWNGGSIGPRSGTPFRWLAANAPQFGFVNLPSEPWHWSDGTATTFDPTVPIPDFPDDTVPEVEPDAETAELLNESLDDADIDVGEEVAVDVGSEPEELGESEPGEDGASDDEVDEDGDEVEGDAATPSESEESESDESGSGETRPPEALASVGDSGGDAPAGTESANDTGPTGGSAEPNETGAAEAANSNEQVSNPEASAGG